MNQWPDLEFDDMDSILCVQQVCILDTSMSSVTTLALDINEQNRWSTLKFFMCIGSRIIRSKALFITL